MNKEGRTRLLLTYPNNNNNNNNNSFIKIWKITNYIIFPPADSF